MNCSAQEYKDKKSLVGRVCLYAKITLFGEITITRSLTGFRRKAAFQERINPISVGNIVIIIAVVAAAVAVVAFVATRSHSGFNPPMHSLEDINPVICFNIE